MRKTHRWILHIVTAFMGCLSFVAGGYAQNLEKGDVEATAQLGIVAGVGTHGSLNGSVGTAITDKLFAFGELGWIPLGGANATVNGIPGGNINFESGGRILSFMVGAQYQLREMTLFTPYAAGALGLVHSSQSVTQTLGGTTTNVSLSNSNFYVSFGGGARHYFNDKWGFKPEFMIFAGDNTFFRFGAGVFYEFGSRR
jgi:Outer membrane protein beta-barrel domain